MWIIYQKGKKLITNLSLIALQLTFEDLCFATNSFPTIFPINCFPINCFCTYYLPWIISELILGDKEKRNVSQYPIEANVCIKFPRMKKSNKGKCESWWENIKLSSGCPAEGKWYKILIRHFVLRMEIPSSYWILSSNQILILLAFKTLNRGQRWFNWQKQFWNAWPRFVLPSVKLKCTNCTKLDNMVAPS